MQIENVTKSRVNIPNHLKVIVKEYNLSQVRSPYLEIHCTTTDNIENNQLLRFSQFELNDLYYLNLSPYQIKNSISYYIE